MAIFGQNLTKFEHDAFTLEFVLTDASININSTTHCAWWGLGDDSDINSCASLLLQGHSTSNVSTYDISVDANDCSQTPTGNALSTTTSAISITMLTNTVRCSLSYSVFDNIADGSYAHELVLMDKSGSTCFQCRSVVASVGILTVNESMFTNFVYR